MANGTQSAIVATGWLGMNRCRGRDTDPILELEIIYVVVSAHNQLSLVCYLPPFIPCVKCKYANSYTDYRVLRVHAMVKNVGREKGVNSRYRYVIIIEPRYAHL